jgi:hypothetical protein
MAATPSLGTHLPLAMDPLRILAPVAMHPAGL